MKVSIKTRLYRLLLLLVFSIASNSLIAEQNSLSVLDPTSFQALSKNSLFQWGQEKHWLRLMHARATSDGYATHIDSEEFFYSGISPLDPASELTETLKAFVARPDDQCRYPARAEWLSKKLQGIGMRLADVSCPEYEQWLEFISPESVSLVFASSYLNSPSSMYGHTLIRIDPESNSESNPLLSYAINFAAAVNPDENSLLYTFKGLTGGYPGYFSLVEYQKKIKEYTRVDNRDLWEYPLRLSREERIRLMAHVWELREVKFDYFFFKENCSYRLLALLEVANEDLELSGGYRGYAIPVDTIRTLDRAGILATPTVRLSDRLQLQKLADSLPDADQKLAIAIAEERSSIAALADLPESRRGPVAKLALDYWKYRNQKTPRSEKNTELSFELLKAIKRNAHSLRLVTSKDSLPARPDLGHRSAAASLAFGELDSQYYSQLTGRFAYQDLLDYSKGYPAFMELIMGELKVRQYEDDHVELDQIDLVSIASFSPRNDLFKPVSWRVRIGGNRTREPERPFTMNLAAQFGHTYSLRPSLVTYVMAGSRLAFSNNRREKLDGAVVLSSGLLANREKHSAALNLDHSTFSSGGEWFEAKFEYSYALKTNLFLRLSAAHHKILGIEGDDASLSLGIHF